TDVPEGRRVAHRLPRRPARVRREPARISPGPRELLDLGLPAPTSDREHLAMIGYGKRALPLLILLACAKKEEPQEPRPPAGEVWLSRQQIDAQEMRLTTVAEEVVETHLDAPGRIACDDLLVSHAFPPASG